ncbi:ribosome control protein 1 [Gorgonomyces haynaldii]|nr:ribosome control protein 1 [Gorgonomyces haynaldii]
MVVVLVNHGVLVGVQQQLHLNATLGIAQFSAEIRTHLFIQVIGRHLLQRGLCQEAYEFFSNYRSLEYFGHILEVLLHKILDETGNSPKNQTLKETLQLVRRFPISLETIVNCARKSEMSLWKAFFDAGEDAKTLFYVSLLIVGISEQEQLASGNILSDYHPDT